MVQPVSAPGGRWSPWIRIVAPAARPACPA